MYLAYLRWQFVCPQDSVRKVSARQLDRIGVKSWTGGHPDESAGTSVGLTHSKFLTPEHAIYLQTYVPPQRCGFFAEHFVLRVAQLVVHSSMPPSLPPQNETKVDAEHVGEGEMTKQKRD